MANNSSSNSSSKLDDDVPDYSSFLPDQGAAAAGPEGQWSFSSHSQRSSQIFDNLPRRLLANDKFNLVYDAVDALLPEEGKVEIRHSLSQVRKTVFELDNG